MYQPYWPERNTDKRLTNYTLYRLKGFSMRQSAIQAGYSESTANMAHERVEPKAKLRIKEALEAEGVSNEKIAGVIKAGMEATKLAGKYDQVVTDYRERREHAKLALEATGELKSGSTVAVQINFPAGLAEMFASDAAEYEGE